MSVLCGKDVSYKTEDEYPIYQFVEKLNQWIIERRKMEIEYAQKLINLHLIHSNKEIYDQLLKQIEKLLIMDKYNEALTYLNSVNLHKKFIKIISKITFQNMMYKTDGREILWILHQYI